MSKQKIMGNLLNLGLGDLLSVGKLWYLFEELGHSSIAPVTLLNAIELLDHGERGEAALFAVQKCSVSHLLLSLSITE